MRGRPDGKSIANADEVATTLSANYFLRAELNDMIQKNHLEEEYMPVMIPLDQNSRLVRVRDEYMMRVPEKAFQGIATPDDLNKIKVGTLNFIDASVYEKIGQVEMSKVVMPYYIDENSQLSRGYIIDGETL